MATCRRCSECEGKHHWMDNPDATGPADPTHACKHCDALGEECEECDHGDAGGVVCTACRGYGVIEVKPGADYWD